MDISKIQMPKFQIWDGKKMYKWREDISSIHANGIIQLRNGRMLHISENKIRTCIDLKDTKGDEIYTYDIVHLVDEFEGIDAIGYIKYEHGTYVIETKNGTLRLGCSPDFNWYTIESVDTKTELTIIGNIYENPELM